MKETVLLLVAFLLGSIPYGVIIAKSRGIDLKKTGSGNIGATNVLRSAGKIAALLTLTGDLLKGTAAMALARLFSAGQTFEGVMGLMAIAGHVFSPFLGFKGGKGVATAFGVLVIYSPVVAAISIIVWLAVVYFTKYSSLGAIISFALLPVNIILFDFSYQKLTIAILIMSLLLLKHTENIKRLLKGAESRVGQSG